MFTAIKAKNFKSLDNIEINFCKNKSTINNFVAIYGENGAGKTNIVELFEFIYRTMTARTFDVKLSEVVHQDLLALDINSLDFYKQIFNVKLILNEYTTIEEKEPTELLYYFTYKDYKYKYYLKYKNKIIKEEMSYAKLTSEKYDFIYATSNEAENIIYLNDSMFINKKYNKELLEGIKKYWGKYTFLSLLVLENVDKNMEYVRENVGEILYDSMDYLISTYIQIKDDKTSFFPKVSLREEDNFNLESGTIPQNEKKKLLKYEEMLNIFFMEAYSDIKEVKYKFTKNEEQISYELVFDKMIGGKIRKIPASMESTGTRRLLSHFYKLIMALDGKTVVIDEIDDGIHDILMKNIIMSLKDEITGQLIITTHNTLLLEELPKESIYIIVVDRYGGKTVNSLKDYNYRIQKNNNARNLYLKGMFGGTPLSEYIDFEAIKEIIKDKE